MAIAGVNHVTLVVADLARARAFYQGILGAVPRAEGARAVYLELGGLWLCLEHGAPKPARDDSHLALSCEAAAFDALAARIKDVATLWKENSSEGASLYFADPDGHKLELHCGDLETRLAHYRAHPEKGMKLV